MTWSDIFLKALKDNDVRLVAYGPDNVLKPLISGVHADNNFMPIVATREGEALRPVLSFMQGMGRPAPALADRRGCHSGRREAAI